MAIRSNLIGFGIIAATFVVAIMLSKVPSALFLDPATMLVMALFILGGLWAAYGPRRICDAVMLCVLRRSSSSAAETARARRLFDSAGQLTWAAGIVTVLMWLISMLGDMSDPVGIGIGISVGLIPMLYAAFLAELVIAPLRDSLSSTSDDHDLLDTGQNASRHGMCQ
jgi:hypothetical protein